ncbi:uncharacterized protein LOC129745998 [Uranotaenia lowii]|uniref:uncharacterized protein LOC129745998 n=1 Tax=Uranotaenia lowii TaxID=190385 RepID=UPI002479B8CC|nr:uncharacterized protein LOC129745998 [Uranotaenia lowii]
MQSALFIGLTLLLGGSVFANLFNTSVYDGFHRPDRNNTQNNTQSRCTGQADGTLFPSLNNCSFFVSCLNSTEVELECRPSGTLFDYERQVCDYEEFVTCFSPDRCAAEPDGLIPSEDCSKFHICRGGAKVEEVTCVPSGTLFDYIRGVCDHPSNVVCWGSSQNLCEGKPDGAPVPDKDCSYFSECLNGEAGEPIRCQPEGTVFDYQREVCDFVGEDVCWTGGNIGGGNSTTEAPGTTVAPTRPPSPELPPGTCNGIQVGSLPYPNDCTMFIACILGQPLLQPCPPGQIYIESIAQCGKGDINTCEADPRWLEEFYKQQGRYPVINNY